MQDKFCKKKKLIGQKNKKTIFSDENKFNPDSSNDIRITITS